MRKITLFDNSVVDGDIGYDPATTSFVWRSDVKSIEFEDGKILKNPNFNLITAKKNKILQIEQLIINQQLQLNAAQQNNLIGLTPILSKKISDLQEEIAKINLL